MSAFPQHQPTTPVYSEAPEPVYPTHNPTQDTQTPIHDTISPQSTAQSPQAMHQEKQYPFQPDSIGEVPGYAPSPSKEYPNQPQPQQFYTPATHPSGYMTAVPLHSVQSAPCPVDCPVCGQREMTRVEAVSGGTTHGWAAILCFCCCLGCIPYLMTSLKDVDHSCGKCGAKLATWHNILTASSALYFYTAHTRLSKRITHTSHQGTLLPTEIETIPKSIFTPQYFTIHDTCSKTIPRACLPDQSTDLLFTRLVRRNMIAFSRFPQALMLAMVSKTSGQRESFKRAHINALEFREGDLVCGVYQVRVRSGNKVEFEISMHGVDYVQGRLAISFKEIERDDVGMVVFSSETVMWRRADEKRCMPLERAALRWMHETAAWWLLDSGVKYLMDLE
ncbi:unnamed protein product [Penicillium olsonii]|nr:unnamed protein product [Penicillium olsonii]